MNRPFFVLLQWMKNAPISLRWYFVLLCCLLVFCSLSWSGWLSPLALSAEPESIPPVQATPNYAPLYELDKPADPTQTNLGSNPEANPQTNPEANPGTAIASLPTYNPKHIAVLNYHSITVDPGNPAVITPDKFKAQMLYLSTHGYTTLTLQQFIDFMDHKVPITMPEKPVLLTFDDGYADNYEQAMPILKELDFHATLFISPGMTEDGYYLNWEQIKEMHKAGWDIQPHGMTHPHLPRLNAAQQANEITEAKRQIEEQLGIEANVFCYPYGERNANTIKLLEEQGFRYAFTIEQGLTTREQQKFALKRLFVNGEESIDGWISRLERAFPD